MCHYLQQELRTNSYYLVGGLHVPAQQNLRIQVRTAGWCENSWFILSMH